MSRSRNENAITRWLDPEEIIKSEYGEIKNIEWLRRESVRIMKGTFRTVSLKSNDLGLFRLEYKGKM